MPERNYDPEVPKFKVGDVVIKTGEPNRTSVEAGREFIITKVLKNQSPQWGHAYCGGEEWCFGGAWEDELRLVRAAAAVPNGYAIIKVGQRVEINVEGVFYTSGKVMTGRDGEVYLTVPKNRWKMEATYAE